MRTTAGQADVLAVGELRPGPIPVCRPAPAAVAAGEWPAHRLEAATEESLVPPDRIRRLGRGQAMATRAVQLALRGDCVPPARGNTTAVVVGTAWAEEGDEIAFLQNVIKVGEKGAKPAFFVNSVKNALASQIALQFGFQGENQTIAHDALSFEAALWQGARLLTAGRADRAVVCGVDALVEFQEIHGHVLGQLRDSPAPLSPLGEGLRGTVPGEGAAAFILSAPDVARSRLARIAGVRSGGSAQRHPALQVDEERRFVEQALADFGVPLDGLDLLLLGANGDASIDPTYSRVAAALGERASRASVGVYRHLTGDFATASALGLALAVEAVASQSIPAAIRLVSGTPSARPSSVALYHVTARGHHAVMAVSR